uniref:Uncharacterized protein n=1 Tax=Arundo donax TaxID=35708 RepID=A0A0A8YXD4_ARUDO
MANGKTKHQVIQRKREISEMSSQLA